MGESGGIAFLERYEIRSFLLFNFSIGAIDLIRGLNVVITGPQGGCIGIFQGDYLLRKIWSDKFIEAAEFLLLILFLSLCFGHIGSVALQGCSNYVVRWESSQARWGGDRSTSVSFQVVQLLLSWCEREIRAYLEDE